MLKQGLVAFGTIALIGCGGGDPLGEEDARMAFDATGGITGGGAPNALTVASDCAEGGKVKWKYNLLSGLSAVGDGVDLEYELVFRGCKTNNIKISGKLTWTLSTVTVGTTNTTRFGYTGNLRYSGDINGSCEYDMYWQASSMPGEVGFEYGGTLCGHEAHATLSVGNGSVEADVNSASVDVNNTM